MNRERFDIHNHLLTDPLYKAEFFRFDESSSCIYILIVKRYFWLCYSLQKTVFFQLILNKIPEIVVNFDVNPSKTGIFSL